ncbi:unnamed protein product, partial [marine sediment metagenome]
GEAGFDQRAVILVNGRWLNTGHDGVADSLEQARSTLIRKCEYVYRLGLRKLGEDVPGVVIRPKIEDPEQYLRPFVDFLKEKGEDPKTFVLDALARHRLVIMGEVHHRPRYWAFNASLVEDPRFAENVGAIYMELPSNDQNLVEEFLAAEKLDTEPVIEMLRDMLWMGWPDQPMLDFFVTVWKVNQKLPPEKRLRIVLVDMRRPWEKIQKKEDWGQYDVDRNKFMAENIVRDLRERPGEKKNALFIVGHGHVKLNFRFGDGKTVYPDASSYLCRELGAESVYAFFPHKPVST